jgi:hypothetical protein
MNTQKKIIILLFITFMAVFFCDAMEKDGIQKSPFSLLDLCKMALFKEYYSGLNSLKRTHKTFSAKFASLPPELREANQIFNRTFIFI